MVRQVAPKDQWYLNHPRVAVESMQRVPFALKSTHAVREMLQNCGISMRAIAWGPKEWRSGPMDIGSVPPVFHRYGHVTMPLDRGPLDIGPLHAGDAFVLAQSEDLAFGGVLRLPSLRSREEGAQMIRALRKGSPSESLFKPKHALFDDNALGEEHAWGASPLYYEINGFMEHLAGTLDIPIAHLRFGLLGIVSSAENSAVYAQPDIAHLLGAALLWKMPLYAHGVIARDALVANDSSAPPSVMFNLKAARFEIGGTPFFGLGAAKPIDMHAIVPSVPRVAR